MSHFTEDQLAELEAVFNITRKETLPVLDGRVARTNLVWWRSEKGPQEVFANDHWDNIDSSPMFYQIKKPVIISVIYQD